MRDVLLAEVTLKIKKTWHIKWQSEVCEIWWLLFFSSSGQLELWRHCFPPVLLETTHSECESDQYEPVFLICCTAERKGQALAGSALSRMSSPSQCSSAPLRYVNTPLPWRLTQMNAPRRRLRRHSLRCHNLKQAGQYFPSAVAYQPEHCTHVPTWPPQSLSIQPSGFLGNWCRCDSPYHSILIWVSNAKQMLQIFAHVCLREIRFSSFQHPIVPPTCHCPLCGLTERAQCWVPFCSLTLSACSAH